MNRYDAREHAFAVIFSADFQKDTSIDSIIDLYTETNQIEKDEYFLSLVQTTKDNLSEIDAVIEEHLNNWSFARLSKVSVAALRMGVCEIKYFESTPDNVAINEAVEIAKKYEETKCGGFVNGVLSAVVSKK